MDEIAPRIWRWAGRHPEWSPGAFGAEVGSYALVTDSELLLVDPLLPPEPAPVLERLDLLAEGRRAHVLVTLEYHVRSAELLVDRYGAELRGPADMVPRLEHPERLVAWVDGEPGPASVVPFAVDGEWPLWFPTHAAIAFGDVVVRNPDGEVRIWEQEAPDATLQAGLTRALAPLAELPSDHLLTTHGAPEVGGGAAALRAAVAASPWEFAD